MKNELYFVKITRQEKVYYCSPMFRETNIFNGLQTFLDVEAYAAMKRLRDEHNKYIDEICEVYKDNVHQLKSLEERRNSVNFEVISLAMVPEHEDFQNGFPLDSTNIPDYNRDVSIIWRDGSRCGVVTNFLRDAMLKGDFLHPDRGNFIRWTYIEDSIYLKLKKQTDENEK